jgi:hypothetical protein
MKTLVLSAALFAALALPAFATTYACCKVCCHGTNCIMEPVKALACHKTPCA